MVEKYSVKDLQAVAKGKMVPPPCDETMQITVESADSGVAYGVWQIDEKFINGLGVVMGGFLSSAADIMMAYAITSMLTEDQGFATIDLHTTFHRPAFKGEITVMAKVERLGRTLAYVVADITQAEKKVASAVSSVLIMQPKES